MAKKPEKKEKLEYSLEQILRAIKGCHGIMLTVAKRLGCDWRTAKNKILSHPEAIEAFENEGLSGIDEAESILFKKVEEGDMNALSLYLSKKGRRRGWGTEAEAMNWKGVLKAKED